MAHVKGFNASCRVPWWHLPVGLFDSEEEYCRRYGPQCRSAKFCVVRDPRTRIFSQFGALRYHAREFLREAPDVVEWVLKPGSRQAYVRSFRAYIRRIKRNPCFGYGMHFGQYDMVFDKSGKRLCDHVLRFEDLGKGAFEELMQEHGMCDVRLGERKVNQHVGFAFRWNAVSEKVRQWVLKFYHKDFEAFYPEVLENPMVPLT